MLYRCDKCGNEYVAPEPQPCAFCFCISHGGHQQDASMRCGFCGAFLPDRRAPGPRRVQEHNEGEYDNISPPVGHKS